MLLQKLETPQLEKAFFPYLFEDSCSKSLFPSVFFSLSNILLRNVLLTFLSIYPRGEKKDMNECFQVLLGWGSNSELPGGLETVSPGGSQPEVVISVSHGTFDKVWRHH